MADKERIRQLVTDAMHGMRDVDRSLLDLRRPNDVEDIATYVADWYEVEILEADRG